MTGDDARASCTLSKKGKRMDGGGVSHVDKSCDGSRSCGERHSGRGNVHFKHLQRAPKIILALDLDNGNIRLCKSSELGIKTAYWVDPRLLRMRREVISGADGLISIKSTNSKCLSNRSIITFGEEIE